MPQWSCTLHWRDNNNHKAESRTHYSGGLSLAAVVARAEALAAQAQAASSAALVAIELSKRIHLDGAPAPEPESDTRAYLALFYGNDTRAATLLVPSPRPLSADLVGPYRNVRLVLDDPSVSPLLAALGGELAGVLAPGGEPWPLPLLAGGFTRYQGGV
jgi:hypothetical protein